MEISLRKHQDIYILDAVGDLDMYNSKTLKDLFAKIIAKNITKMVLNLEKVDYIDSSGVGTLIQIHAQSKQKRIQLYLCNIQGTVKKVLTLTKLDNFFPTADSIEDAVKAIIART